MTLGERERAEQHLRATTERFEALMRKYGVDLDSGTVEARKALIELISMAAQRTMLEVAKETASAVDFARMLFEAREVLLRQLWRQDRFATPWALLVSREFPGSMPDYVDLEYYEEDATKDQEQETEIKRQQMLKLEKMRKFLEDLGYGGAENDVVQLVQLSTLSQMLGTRLEAGGSDVSAQHLVDEMVARVWKIIGDTQWPTHKAWTPFVEKFFSA